MGIGSAFGWGKTRCFSPHLFGVNVVLRFLANSIFRDNFFSHLSLFGASRNYFWPTEFAFEPTENTFVPTILVFSPTDNLLYWPFMPLFASTGTFIYNQIFTSTTSFNWSFLALKSKKA